MPLVPISSNTQAQMKADIAAEIGRPDLTAQIASKITEAIEFYQATRFWFSETRDITFNTVAGQEFYTSSDNAAIPTLVAFDYIILYIGAIPWPIARRTDVEIEVLNQNGFVRGQPWNWSYYNEQVRLGPIPDTVYQIRIAAHQNVAPPTSDAQTGNPWMTNAELLIRRRAKHLLFKDVIRNKQEADSMAEGVEEALGMLVGKTNRLLGRGTFAPMEF